MPQRQERQSGTKDDATGTQRRSVPQAGFPDIDRLSLSDAAGLQKLVGNRAVGHLVAQRRMAPEDRSTAEDVTPEQINQVVRDGGKPLDEPILQRAEGATGMDMSHVRVHTGADAAASAAAMAARAYTIGSDIVVGSAGADEETLLHEAKHVEQQARGAVPGRSTAGGLHLSRSDDSAEREATRFAAQEVRRPAAALPALREPERPAEGHEVAAVQRVTVDESAEDTQTRGSLDITPVGPVRETSADPGAEILEDDAGEIPKLDEPLSAEARKDLRHKLSVEISANTVATKIKLGLWDYVTRPWYKLPDKFLPEKTRLRKTLEMRAIKGKPFSSREMDLIKTLSKHDPAWLSTIGIGTFDAAEQLSKGEDPGKYKNWVQERHGRRILAATLSYNRHKQTPGGPTPIDPAYTLGRFMTTQGLEAEDPLRGELENERDAQIRKTAVDTLHPEGLAASELHSDQTQLSDNDKARAASAGGILTNVLHVLQAGLKVRDASGGYQDHEGDVIRALAHGGRVNIRVPATTGTEGPDDLLEYLGVLQGGKRSDPVSRRGIATHHTSIAKNKGEQRGKFVEKGEAGAGLINLVTEYPAAKLEEWSDSVAGRRNKQPAPKGAAKLMGVPIPGGGVGSKDWNGDVVLPDDSHGHMLLVWTPPTTDKDGSLLVGIETIGPGATSPVGYKHGVTSSEATANPESVLHGHKPDKIGEGKTEDNPRLVDLAELKGDNGWLGVLDGIKQTFDTKLQDASGSTAETRALYEELVGRRKNL